jgi:hypothetical protein
LVSNSICTAALLISSLVVTHPGDANTEKKQGIIKLEQINEYVFSVTYRRLWEEDYYMTHVYIVDCKKRLATFQGGRHMILVTEEHLVAKVCDF